MTTDPRTTVYGGARPRASSRPPRARTQSSRLPRVGETLGAYRLCAEIGGGGMATVYLARTHGRAGVHRFVALKCIRPEFASNTRFVEMFFDEARIASQIHHANVCSVLDFDHHHGTYFLAMELLAGRTLTAVLQQLYAATELADAGAQVAVFARLLESACEGLHAAHEATSSAGEPLHVVHRDVSPDNLFVTYDGTIKVMDFGVASSAEPHPVTRTGVLKGKCAYLAPEVIAGTKPDRRADIWGLGVVAWELIARRKLFDQPNDAAKLRAIGEQEIPGVSTTRPGVPQLLDPVIARALERDPARRYQTAREFGRMLNRFLVEQRQIVGLAEIAEFMRTLFPEGVACANQLVRVAEQLDPPHTPRPRDPWRDAATVADPAVAHELARQSVQPAPTTEQVVRAARRRWLGASLVVATIALALAGLAVAWQASRDHADASSSEFTLEATPVGTDPSGAVLLRVHVVPRH